MNQLPSTVTDLLSKDDDVLKAVFKVDPSFGAVFVNINDKFVEFHKQLGITIIPDDLTGSSPQDYFRIYLGFTEDQIESRMTHLNTAVKEMKEHSFKEVSDHPGIPVLVLDSIWKPVKVDDMVYMIWESRVYVQSEI